MRTQAYVDNKVDDLRYEIKFETRVKDKNNFFIKRNIAFLSWTKMYFILGDIFFYNSYEFDYLSVFLPRQITKNIDMPRQKPQMLLW